MQYTVLTTDVPAGHCVRIDFTYLTLDPDKQANTLAGVAAKLTLTVGFEKVKFVAENLNQPSR